MSNFNNICILYFIDIDQQMKLQLHGWKNMTFNLIKLILPIIIISGCNSDSVSPIEISSNIPTEYKIISSTYYDISIYNSTSLTSNWSSANSALQHIDEEIYYPDAASDNNGNIVTVWQSEYNPNYESGYSVVFSTTNDNGKTWSPPAPLNPIDTPTSSYDENPQVSTDGKGNWVAVWSSDEDIESSGTDDDIVFVHSTDNGNTWTEPKPVGNHAIGNSQDWYAQISVKEHIWVVLWTSNYQVDDLDASGDRDIVLSYSTDKGVTWSDASYVNSNAIVNTETDSMAQLAINNDGYGVVAWSGISDSADLDIYAAVTHDYGLSWTDPMLINTSAITETCIDTCHDYAESVHISENGTTTISWRGNPTSNNDQDVYMSFSSDLGASWSTEINLNTDAFTDGRKEHDYFANVVPIKNDYWLAYWTDAKRGNLTVRTSSDLINWSEETVILTGIEYNAELIF